MLVTIIRTVILYVFIVFAVRIMGKRQISELQTSELVVTLVIADIASIPMENNSQSLASGIVPTLILVGCEILASVGMMKWSKFRRLMCGNPVMVIQDGEILQDKMESLRLTTEDLCIQLRQQGVFSLDDVQYCIAETNGKLSVLEKPKSRKPTAQDVGVEIEDNGIEVVVINDGEILNNSLKLCQAENKTIYKILENNKLTVKDVFIMTMDRNGSYKIIKKDRKKK
jgi:uncharacterized membrane protein YcaP (DUF421 family)